MSNFRIFWNRLIRGGIAGLKAEVLVWVILLTLSGIIYVITAAT